MASNIVLKTYAAGDNNQGSVTPQNDALVYQAAIPTNGIFNGATVTLSSANVLHVAAGFGIMGGRFFEVLENDISVQLSASGELLGRLYIHLDLGNADNPISIESYTGASLLALQGDPNLNLDDGVFDMELCTFSINELTISNIVNTFPTLKAANNQLRRATAYSVGAMVFCQSAADNLVFVCTTAGTTAVQQPMGYATITNGNTITDGTAVFKAVDLIAAINEVNTKLSKTEDLISNSGDAYSPTRPYKVGELCIHEDVLYRCTTACSAGSWATNQSCLTADTLTNVVDELNTITTSSATNTSYAVIASCIKKGNIVSMTILCNKLLTAIPYNTWISLISNIPMSQSQVQLTVSTFGNNVVSFLLDANSSDLKIICRTASGIPVNDGFSANITYICN